MKFVEKHEVKDKQGWNVVFSIFDIGEGAFMIRRDGRNWEAAATLESARKRIAEVVA